MRRCICIIAFIISTIACYSQTILGIKIGESYTNAKKVLKERYASKLYEDGGNLDLDDFYMGEFHFKLGTLYFQWSNSESKFYAAVFQYWDSVRDVESMKSLREILRSKIESKYDIYEYKNKQGCRCYGFSGEIINDVTISGSIDLHRSKIKDGVERLYLILSYSPIADFIKEDSDF